MTTDRGNTPVARATVDRAIDHLGIADLGTAHIREIVQLVSLIERETNESYIRMEMGVPGLPSPEFGADAQIEALTQGVAARYPLITGLPALKEETARFCKLFLNIDVDPEGCVPTVGAMQGAFAAFLVANRNDHTRKGTLFLDPGFPVQKTQCRMLGHEYDSFDVSHYRGEKLRAQLESHLIGGEVSSILFSNPNNPSWICLDEDELETIGELSRRYDVTVIEDLAYFGMDARRDYSTPGKPPYQPSVAHYTDNYMLLISTSKIFSYAGERVGMLVVSDALFRRRYPDLLRYYNSDMFGHALVFGAIYALTAGTSHSAQYAVAKMLKTVNDGGYDFVAATHEYSVRAEVMKRHFTSNGFRVVYDRDRDREIADGFYFTIFYPGMTGSTLLRELLYYGISAMGLAITGSDYPDGLRACVSQFQREREHELAERLARFHRDHPL